MPDSTAAHAAAGPQTLGPVFAWSEPVADVNGYAYADSSVDLRAETTREGGARVTLTVVDTDEREGDDTPEGFAEVYLSTDALRRLAEVLPAILAAVDAL